MIGRRLKARKMYNYLQHKQAYNFKHYSNSMPPKRFNHLIIDLGSQIEFAYNLIQ